MDDLYVEKNLLPEQHYPVLRLTFCERHTQPRGPGTWPSAAKSLCRGRSKSRYFPEPRRITFGPVEIPFKVECLELLRQQQNHHHVHEGVF